VAASVGAAAIATGFLLLERGWSLHENVLLAPNFAPFLMGALAAIIYGRLQQSGPSRRWSLFLEVAAIAALVGALLRVPSLYNLLFPGRDIGKLAYDAPICGALWSVVILGTLHGCGWLAKMMTWAPLRYLGLISFSAYLWHWKFLSDVDDLPVPPVIRLLVFLSIVVAVSSVSYFLLERPLMRVGRRARDPLLSSAP
jgi:peptidoglycan/LPS O-acetylase OafA/YrhL